MRLLTNTWNGFRYLKWSKIETICYLFRGISRETKINTAMFEKLLNKARHRSIKKYFDKKNQCFDFNGAKLPDISNEMEKLGTLKCVFDDVLLFFCHYKDNYSKKFVRFMDAMMTEGPYGYTDGTFDVTVKKGDVVIDAGAWIGDFSAYSASKGAMVYAFEPTKESYDLLCKTKKLNSVKNGGGANSPCSQRTGRFYFGTSN